MGGKMVQEYAQPPNPVIAQQQEEKQLKILLNHKKHNKLNLLQRQYKYLIISKTFLQKS